MSSGLGKMRSAGSTCEESLYRPANITTRINKGESFKVYSNGARGCIIRVCRFEPGRGHATHIDPVKTGSYYISGFLIKLWQQAALGQ